VFSRGSPISPPRSQDPGTESPPDQAAETARARSRRSWQARVIPIAQPSCATRPAQDPPPEKRRGTPDSEPFVPRQPATYSENGRRTGTSTSLPRKSASGLRIPRATIPEHDSPATTTDDAGSDLCAARSVCLPADQANRTMDRPLISDQTISTTDLQQARRSDGLYIAYTSSSTTARTIRNGFPAINVPGGRPASQPRPSSMRGSGLGPCDERRCRPAGVWPRESAVVPRRCQPRSGPSDHDGFAASGLANKTLVDPSYSRCDRESSLNRGHSAIVDPFLAEIVATPSSCRLRDRDCRQNRSRPAPFAASSSNGRRLRRCGCCPSG
jgi:hypothetical protein